MAEHARHLMPDEYMQRMKNKKSAMKRKGLKATMREKGKPKR